jgi:transcriptional regulator with XRE-family HTH domain
MKSNWEIELDELFAHVDPAADATAHLALEIAIQLTALRERRGLSRQDLAARLGLPPRAIARIEDGLDVSGALARLNDAALAMDAVLDIALVPREDLATYRARTGPKPILAATSGGQAIVDAAAPEQVQSDMHNSAGIPGRAAR